jgi:SAM-dependent methyltransferase
MSEWIARLVKLLKMKPAPEIAGWRFRFHTAPEWHNDWSNPEWLAQYLSPERKDFYHEVITLLPVRFSSLLDAGCGCGYLLRLLSTSGVSEHSPKFIGLDISGSAARIATQMCPEASILQGSLDRIPLADDAVDLAVCIEVLEHLLEPRRALEQMIRVLRPKGHLLITVPDGDLDRWEGHNNFWSEAGFREFLALYRLCDFKRIESGRTLAAVLSK